MRIHIMISESDVQTTRAQCLSKAPHLSVRPLQTDGRGFVGQIPRHNQTIRSQILVIDMLEKELNRILVFGI